MCYINMNHRVRSRLLFPKDMSFHKELVCPKPRHAPVEARAPVESRMCPARKLTGSALISAERDAGHEIMDILFQKACPGEIGSPSGPILHGSPPKRSSNPLIHDVHFIQKKAVPVPSFLSPKFNHTTTSGNSSYKKSSCSTSFGAKPFVRIEGFTSSAPEAARGVPAFA